MGSGYRTFTAGEVLTASNVQNYLQDQAVMVFGGSAARSSAIGTANFEEGMTSYLTDTDKLEVYNGTNWVSVAPTSTQGLTLINTTSFSGVSSISLPANTFTSTYQHYFIQAVFYCDSSINIRMRAAGSDNSTASSYQTEQHYGDANVSSALYSTDNIGYGPLSRSGEKTSMQMFVYEPNLATKTYLQFQSVRPPTNMQSYNTGIIHTQTVAYDSMSFISGSGNFATGSKISVYGMNQ